jgi:transcriptional regulator with XRE-family HTH domain
MGAMEKSTFTPEYAVLRDHLIQIRSAAGLTQRALAKRLDVTHSWVAKVESGERRIDLVELCLLLTACGSNPGLDCGQLATRISQIQSKRRRKQRSRP